MAIINQLKIKPIYILGISISLLTTIIIAISVDQGYKVLSDEANILSVSKSFYNNQTSYIESIIIRDEKSSNIHQHLFPIRPFMFPYLVSLLHTIFGYSDQNAIYLNLIFLFL